MHKLGMSRGGVLWWKLGSVEGGTYWAMLYVRLSFAALAAAAAAYGSRWSGRAV